MFGDLNMVANNPSVVSITTGKRFGCLQLIDLSDDFVITKLLVPADEDFPVLAGKLSVSEQGWVLHTLR